MGGRGRGVGLRTNMSANPCQEETRLHTKLVDRKRGGVNERDREREHVIVSPGVRRAEQKKQTRKTTTAEKLLDKSQIFSSFHTANEVEDKGKRWNIRLSLRVGSQSSADNIWAVPKISAKLQVMINRHRGLRSRPPSQTEARLFFFFTPFFPHSLSDWLAFGFKAASGSRTSAAWKQRAAGSCHLSEGRSAGEL